MNTPKISGSWFIKLQVSNNDGELLSGLLIKEKAGSPDPVQEVLPKLTSIEFWAIDSLLTTTQMISKAIN